MTRHISSASGCRWRPAWARSASPSGRHTARRASAATRPERSTLRAIAWASKRECLSLRDFLFDAGDEPVAGGHVVSTGAERVAPLRDAQSRQQVAHPSDVGRSDVLSELLVASVVIEIDHPVLDALDEARPLELPVVAARGVEAAELTERGADVAYDIPAMRRRRTVTRFAHGIQRVVRVLQIGFVEDQHEDTQSVVGASADERVDLPGPLAFILQARMLGPEPRLGLYALRSPRRQRPSRQIVDGRLVIPERRQHARYHDFDLRFGSLLDAPLPAFRIDHAVPGADAHALRGEKGINDCRIRRELFSPGTVEEISLREVVGRFPQLGRLHRCWRASHRRSHDRRDAAGAERRETRTEEKPFHDADSGRSASHDLFNTAHTPQAGATDNRRRWTDAYAGSPPL